LRKVVSSSKPFNTPSHSLTFTKEQEFNNHDEATNLCLYNYYWR